MQSFEEQEHHLRPVREPELRPPHVHRYLSTYGIYNASDPAFALLQLLLLNIVPAPDPTHAHSPALTPAPAPPPP